MVLRLEKFFCYILIIFSLTPYAFAEPKTIYLAEDFMLKIGESVQIEGGLGFIKFIKILEDSRCPINVTCVWAGNVKAEFEILDRDRKKTRTFLNSNVKPNNVLLKGYTLQLISILPPKTKGIKISAKKYQVKLRIEPNT